MQDFSTIEKSTGMSAKEVSASFKAFKKEAGSEKIRLDKFTKLVANMNTNTSERMICLAFKTCQRTVRRHRLIADGNVAEYAKHLFRAFDTDVDGFVSFEEVIVGFHHLSGAGDEKEKLKIVFRVRRINISSCGNVTQPSILSFRSTTRTTTGCCVQQMSRSE